MSELFTLADIEQRTHVPLQRLRYVVDSDILPGWRHGRIEIKTSHGRGVARTFGGFEAFGLVTAVLMLDGGMRRQSVMESMDLLCDYKDSKTRKVASVPLYQAFSCSDITALEIGDGLNVKLVSSAKHQDAANLNVWIQVQTRGKVVDYEPLVSIRINAGKLRSCFSR